MTLAERKAQYLREHASLSATEATLAKQLDELRAQRLRCEGGLRVVDDLLAADKPSASPEPPPAPADPS